MDLRKTALKIAADPELVTKVPGPARGPELPKKKAPYTGGPIEPFHESLITPSHSIIQEPPAGFGSLTDEELLKEAADAFNDVVPKAKHELERIKKLAESDVVHLEKTANANKTSIADHVAYDPMDIFEKLKGEMTTQIGLLSLLASHVQSRGFDIKVFKTAVDQKLGEALLEDLEKELKKVLLSKEDDISKKLSCYDLLLDTISTLLKMPNHKLNAEYLFPTKAKPFQDAFKRLISSGLW